MSSQNINQDLTNKKIAFAGRSYYPNGHGAEMSIHEVLKRLVSRGAEVVALIPADEQRMLDGVRIEPRVISGIHGFFSPDVVIIQGDPSDHWCKDARIMGFKSVLMLRGSEGFLKYKDRICPEPDLAIANSHFVRSQWEARTDIPCTVSYPIIDIKSVNSKKKDKVLFMGGDRSLKGFNVVHKIAELLPNQTFKICGPMDDTSGLPKNIEICGRVEPEEAYKNSWILLAPSLLEEGFGRAAYEASYLGIPIIHSGIGGLNEAAGPLGIDIGEVEDVDDWAHKASEQIKYYLEQPQSLKEFVSNGSDWIRRHGSLNVIIDTIASDPKKTKKKSKTKKVIIGLPEGMGNAVFMLPTIKAFHDKDYEIDVVMDRTGPWHAPIWRQCEWISSVTENSPSFSQLSGYDKVVLGVNRCNNLSGELSAPRTELFKRPEYDVNFDVARKILKTNVIPAVDDWLETDQVEKIWDVIIVPGYKHREDGHWDRKGWSGLGEIKNKLIERDLEVAVVGLENDRPDWDMSDVDDLIGKVSTSDLPATLAKARCVISLDNGPGHVASSLGIPGVMIFTASNDIKGTPLGENTKIIHNNIQCRPCWGKPDWNDCSDWKCQEIDPEIVWRELSEILFKNQVNILTPFKESKTAEGKTGLMLAQTLFPHVGGGEMTFFRYADIISKTGLDLKIRYANHQEPPKEFANKYDIKRYPDLGRLIERSFSETSPDIVFVRNNHLVKYIQSNPPKVPTMVLVQYWSGILREPRDLHKLKGSLVEHATPELIEAKKRGFQFVANSPYTQWILSRLGIQSQYVLSIPDKKTVKFNERDRTEENALIFISVSKYDCELIERIIKAFPNRKCIISKWEQNQEEVYARLNSYSNVELIDGPVEPKELLRRAGVVVNPSFLSESFSRLQLECLMTNTPSVYSNMGNMPYLSINAGVCVDSWKPKDWIEAIKRADEAKPEISKVCKLRMKQLFPSNYDQTFCAFKRRITEMSSVGRTKKVAVIKDASPTNHMKNLAHLMGWDYISLGSYIDKFETYDFVVMSKILDAAIGVSNGNSYLYTQISLSPFVSPAEKDEINQACEHLKSGYLKGIWFTNDFTARLLNDNESTRFVPNLIQVHSEESELIDSIPADLIEDKDKYKSFIRSTADHLNGLCLVVMESEGLY